MHAETQEFELKRHENTIPAKRYERQCETKHLEHLQEILRLKIAARATGEEYQAA